MDDCEKEKACWTRRTGLIEQPVGEELLLYDEGRDEIVVLNAVARRIWEEYLVDRNRLRRDVRETLETMLERGLICKPEREARLQ